MSKPVEIDVDRNRATELAATIDRVIDGLPEDIRYAIREAAESRFKTYRRGDTKAGLKRGAEIAGKTAIYLHHDAGEVKKAKGARAVERAIQREISKDCSPSVSRED